MTEAAAPVAEAAPRLAFDGTPMRTNAMGFEIETCSRCGGSGRYSWNAMNGDRCFGCSGTGLRHSKRGAAAHKAYLTMQDRPVSQIKPGEAVWYDPFPFGGRAGWRYVLRVDNDELNPGLVKLTLEPRNRQQRDPSAYVSVGVFANGTVRSVRDEAHRKELLEAALLLQATLGVSGKPVKKVARCA